ncbi:MAG: hypothetical protein AUJ20_11235 [Comamonadaceae bacterium CG1_02_60_18]|nr:MAG: hypothetical protein AUJ20_11235 [Comamonadaceae bacterium CG1_02_60_18]PIQ52895.1 MAG: hypothetical protein COW02_09010 [Comamonadaceae bacterium CG12_big_fil_rev_8_21_14_0_65_59_15]
MLALWHWSGAARIVLVSGFAGYVVLAPAHPWACFASQLRPRGLPVRPPWGLPQNRAGGHAAFGGGLLEGLLGLVWVVNTLFK